MWTTGKKMLVIAMCALGCTAVFSKSAIAINQFEVYGSVQSMTWREFDETGSQLLKETGPLYGIGGQYRYYDEDDSKWILSVRGELYAGKLDYEGSEPLSSGPSPRINTDASYFIMEWHGDVGWKLKLGEDIVCAPFVGGGGRWWVRQLDNAYAANGTLKHDYTELWNSTFVKAGLRLDFWTGTSASGAFFVESAVTVPLFTHIEVLSGDEYDPSVNPRSAPSLSAETGLRIGKARVSVYYEGLRFYRSRKDTDGLGFVHYQPKSEADIVGVRGGFAF